MSSAGLPYNVTPRYSKVTSLVFENLRELLNEAGSLVQIEQSSRYFNVTG